MFVSHVQTLRLRRQTGGIIFIGDLNYKDNIMKINYNYKDNKERKVLDNKWGHGQVKLIPKE